MNYGMRFMTVYRRQGSRPSPWKRNEKKQIAVWGGLTNSCEKKRSKKQRVRKRQRNGRQRKMNRDAKRNRHRKRRRKVGWGRERDRRRRDPLRKEIN